MEKYFKKYFTKCAPSRWLYTKKLIEPAHMKEYLKKIRLHFPNPWQALSAPLLALGDKAAINLLKSEGEGGFIKLMDKLGCFQSGSLS